MIRILIIYLLFTGSVLAQPSKTAFKKFYYDLGHNIKVDKELVDNCKWMYALVKVDCNANNEIVSYTYLNNVAPVIKDRFKFLNGYKFDKSISISRRPIVFCVAFENHNSDCILKDRSMSIEGAKEMYGLLSEQINSYPKSIVLQEIELIRYNFDTEH